MDFVRLVARISGNCKARRDGNELLVLLIMVRLGSWLSDRKTLVNVGGGGRSGPFQMT